jgi:hypothetical protein
MQYADEWEPILAGSPKGMTNIFDHFVSVKFQTFFLIKIT